MAIKLLKIKAKMHNEFFLSEVGLPLANCKSSVTIQLSFGFVIFGFALLKT